MLGGIYVASTYSGAITAILLNIPGTPAAVATLLDGHPMSKKGESTRALALATPAYTAALARGGKKGEEKWTLKQPATGFPFKEDAAKKSQRRIRSSRSPLGTRLACSTFGSKKASHVSIF